MEYIDHIIINGVRADIPVTKLLSGKPTTSTVGRVGQFVMDTTSEKHDLYKCVAAKGSVYTWELIDVSGSGGGSDAEAVKFVSQNLTDEQKKQARTNIDAESTNNKVTSISSGSTHTQYPSAKAVYDALSNVSGGDSVDSPIQLIENTDSSNRVPLRSLSSGTYVLKGYFTAYEGSSANYTFSTGMLVAVVVSSGTTYVQIFYPKNNAIQYLEITDEDVFRKDAKLINMESVANMVTQVDESSDDSHYPSAKAVYDAISNVSGGSGDTDLTDVNNRLDELSQEIVNLGGTLVEPAEDDIPKVFFGGALQQTKDEAVVPFSYRSKTLSFDCYAEIKAQGNSTLSWPKKNQTVKLYADADCSEKIKIDFKGWGKQNKFVIKANWRDLTHVRDIVSVRLEGDCLRSNPDYDTFPEHLKTSPNMGGIDGFPVVVYAAGVYQGRYMWNIPKDKWMTNMDDELDEHCILCSEDYNSSCFRAAANINGSDWTDEIHDVVPASIKTRWNEVISFVMNSSDEEFVANLDSYIKVSTLIDRHLMGLLSCDFDGYGKNQLYITYDGQQWYADRYDKDGTWGNYWTGNSMLPSNYGREQYEDMISDRPGNLLFIRLEKLFWERLQSRWAELRVNELSIPNIINRFRELYDITPPYLIEEDYASTTANGAFTGIPNQTTCTIQQIQKFVVERHAWTDTYVAGLTPEVEVPCTGITLDNTTLTFTGTGTKTITATVIPDGCTDTMVWVSSNPSAATITVDGNVCTVEAVANGDTTVTVTCGEYSASCSVSVSGIAEGIPCTGITLDKSALTFTGTDTQTLTATVTPSDTTDKVVWSSDNTAVANVANGVVTPVADGSANITAVCGNYSANCTVTVSGVAEAPLYSLAETAFDGTNIVDTGVQLFNEDKDFTVIIEAQATNSGAKFIDVNGMFFVTEDTAYRTGFGKVEYHFNAIGKKAVAVFVKESNKSKWLFINEDKAALAEATWSFVQTDETLKIGNKTIGTVYSCRVYNRAISYYDAISMIGVDMVNADIVWSNTPSYSINSGDVVSGKTNYITPDAVAVPDGYTGAVLENINGSTFTWQGVAQYDADMAFIKYKEGSETTSNIVIGLDANTKYVRFSAYPNGNSDPENGMAAAFFDYQ